MTAQPLLTTREVAELHTVSPRRCCANWRAGEIPGYRVGGNVLCFSADEVAAWLEARRTRKRTPPTSLQDPVPPYTTRGNRRQAEVLLDLEGNIEG